MTDRYKGCVVTFDRDIREDDATYLLNAIRMVKGVISVTPSELTSEDHMVRMRLNHQIRQKLYDAMDNAMKDLT